MKKLIIALAVVISTVGFASANEKKAGKVNVLTSVTATVHCYTMKGGVMLVCYGTTTETMSATATLRNGTTISNKGEVTTKDGKKSLLASGQCIDLMGVVGDYAKMHTK